MKINPPIQILSSESIHMYDTEIYLQVKYPIENIYDAIKKSYLSKASITNWDSTLEIFDIDWWNAYNIIVQEPEGIDENFWMDKAESIELIEIFISNN